jgi:hypothetical protein
MTKPQPVTPTCDDCTHVTAKMERLDAHIRYEFDLVSHRMTWLVISQSFMLTAYTTALANLDDGRNFRLLPILWVAPVFGMSAALLVALAIKAAHSAVRKLKTAREALESTDARRCGVDIPSVSDHSAESHPFQITPRSTKWGIYHRNTYRRS